MKEKRNEKEENTRLHSTIGASSLERCFVTFFSSDVSQAQRKNGIHVLGQSYTKVKQDLYRFGTFIS